MIQKYILRGGYDTSAISSDLIIHIVFYPYLLILLI